jgi:hypothetical protein
MQQRLRAKSGTSVTLYVNALEQEAFGVCTPEVCVYYWCVLAVNLAHPRANNDLNAALSATDCAFMYAGADSALRYEVSVTRGICLFLQSCPALALDAFLDAQAMNVRKRPFGIHPTTDLGSWITEAHKAQDLSSRIPMPRFPTTT